jgi:osmotically-inducible protein OsmY
MAMKADEELQTAVVEALKRAPEVTASEVGVAVTGGAVRLSGGVHTCSEKYAAERAALSVPDVRAVSQEIRVLGAELDDRDWAVAEAVSRALQSEADVPATVQATVEGGWVTLQGEVAAEAQREAAAEAVRRRSGVQRLYNLVTVEPTAQPVLVNKEMGETPRRYGVTGAECVVA